MRRLLVALRQRFGRCRPCKMRHTKTLRGAAPNLRARVPHGAAGRRTGRDGSAAAAMARPRFDGAYRARLGPSLAVLGHAAAIRPAIESCSALFRRRSFAFAFPDWLISGARAQIDRFCDCLQ